MQADQFMVLKVLVKVIIPNQIVLGNQNSAHICNTKKWNGFFQIEFYAK
jgi:hypothetical protein